MLKADGWITILSRLVRLAFTEKLEEGQEGIWGRVFQAEGTARAKTPRQEIVRHVKGTVMEENSRK